MSDTAATRSPHAQIAADLLHERSWVSQPAVSPNGQHVAHVVATIDLEANTTRSKVWLDDSVVTAGEHDHSPIWSPDGRQLAFVSRRGEKKGDSTLHVLPVHGPGELRTVCTMPDGLGEVSWSPDGSHFAFTSRTQDARYETQDVSWQSPRKVERFLSRLNGEDWIFDRPSHVYVVRADGTGAPRNLTPGEFQHSGTAWLGDSSAVITSAMRHDTWDLDLATDLYAIDADPALDAVIEAFLSVARRLPWRQTRSYLDVLSEEYLANYGYVQLLGPPPSIVDHRSVRVGIGLWGPDLHYPLHEHAAEELRRSHARQA